MVNNQAILLWKKEDNVIKMDEHVGEYRINKYGQIKIGNKTTDMYITVSSLREFEDKIYDLASRFFSDWSEEISYDGYFKYNDKPAKAIIIGIERIEYE